MRGRQELTDLRLPADEFYFAILETSSLPRAVSVRRDRAKLDYLFESHLPVAIESVQADYLHLEASRILACGMDRDKLVTKSDHALRLGPESLPVGLINESESVAIDQVNLLRDEFEPVVVQAARRRGFVHTLAAIIICTALFGIAIERRARQGRATKRQADRLIDGLLEERYGPPAAGRQHRATRLTADLRRLTQTRSVGQDVSVLPSDITNDLAGILGAWPRDLGVRTDRLSIRADGFQLAAWAPDTEQADHLIRALGTAPGWRTGGRQSVERARDGAALTLDLRPLYEKLP